MLDCRVFASLALVGKNVKRLSSLCWEAPCARHVQDNEGSDAFMTGCTYSGWTNGRSKGGCRQIASLPQEWGAQVIDAWGGIVT